MTVISDKTRILIVVESFVIREVIKSFYDEYCFELIEAANGQDAVDMARACTPDLILLDIGVPLLKGFNAVANLKKDEAVKTIPILAITGQERGEVAERISGMCDGCVSIPFKKTDLMHATIQCLPTAIKNQWSMRAIGIIGRC